MKRFTTNMPLSAIVLEDLVHSRREDRYLLAAEAEFEFLARLQRLLHEGSFVASYRSHVHR